MNIFATSSLPTLCAKALDNRRLVKMVLETAQILAVARAANGLKSPYGLTHKGHPVCKWAGDNRINLSWTSHLFLSLADEYERRYGREHKSVVSMGRLAHSHIETGLLTPDQFQNCARNSSLGIDFTNISDTHRAYRLYLNMRWRIELSAGKYVPVWKDGYPPVWADALVKEAAASPDRWLSLSNSKRKKLALEDSKMREYTLLMNKP